MSRMTRILASLGVVTAAAAVSIGGAGAASAQPGAPLGEDLFCYYIDVNFEGDTYCPTGDKDLPPGIGYQTNTTPESNDQASSIRVKPGYVVRMYVDTNGQGPYREAAGDVADLTTLGINDQVSSLVVLRA